MIDPCRGRVEKLKVFLGTAVDYTYCFTLEVFPGYCCIPNIYYRGLHTSRPVFRFQTAPCMARESSCWEQMFNFVPLGYKYELARARNPIAGNVGMCYLRDRCTVIFASVKSNRVDSDSSWAPTPLIFSSSTAARRSRCFVFAGLTLFSWPFVAL